MTYQTDEKLPAAKNGPPSHQCRTRRVRRPLAGWVYFLRGEETGRFKIGRAKDPEKRFKSVQTGCVETLWPWAAIPSCDPAALEALLHRRARKDGPAADRRSLP